MPIYKGGRGRCPLCLEEKLAIINTANDHVLLNKRTELLSKCRHGNSFLAKNFKDRDPLNRNPVN